MGGYAKFDLKDGRQIDAFLHVLNKHSAEDCITIGHTVRGEVFIGAKNNKGKLKCMHYIKPDGCVVYRPRDEEEE